MPTPKSKEELLLGIRDNYKKLCLEYASIPAAFTNIKDLEGHAKNTTMSINNLLSYLVGWTQLLLKWQDRKVKRLKVDFPETGYKWNELGKLAQKFYADYEADDIIKLRIKLAGTTADIINLIESKSNEQLFGKPWHEEYTLGKMIHLNTSAPFENARNRIKKWKKTKQF